MRFMQEDLEIRVVLFRVKVNKLTPVDILALVLVGGIGSRGTRVY